MTRARPISHQFHANPDWAKLPLFDRKGWKRVRFGDVVENINETCDPEEAGLERFIGLEHLEPGSLHIRKWGDVADGTTFTRQCRPGQVLFGKRRAYQRKVAVAEFEAVVSGDIYVLAPKNDKLLSQLLPFICLSERFFQHAVGTSAGSLSPRTNWSSLANFEFDLPPLDQQRRLAEILWAADETVCKGEVSAKSLYILHQAQLSKTFEDSNGRWPSKQLSEVARVDRGMFSHRPRNLPQFYGGEFPFVQTGDVQNADRYLRRFEYHLTKLGTNYSKIFPTRTIFITIAAVIGATAISDRQVFATDSVVGVVPKEDMSVDFVELFLRSKRHFLENQAATQTAQKNINLQILRPLRIPCPPKEEQERMAAEILEPFHTARQMEAHVDASRSLLIAITDQL
jgi:type I restriction enzyme S subunit